LQYRGVLFDLDGTILDTSNLIVQSFQHTFQVHYQREIRPEEVYPFFGKPLRTAMQSLGPEKVDALISTYREHNLEHHDHMVEAFAGVVDVLKDLYNAGVDMAIVTSKTQGTALRGLKLFELDKYFSAIIGVEQCSHHKPHPEPVQIALQQLKLSYDQCLMVGDSPSDIISAQKAGVKTAAVHWTRVDWKTILASKPDYVIYHMQDLLDIVH
jgi:pyrophosphatase PpaX